MSKLDKCPPPTLGFVLNLYRNLAMHRDANGWEEEYKKRGALWIHDGNPRRPHAELASGKHSNGVFNSRIVITDEELMWEAASDLLQIYLSQGGDLPRFLWVIGPQTGATKLAEVLALNAEWVLRDTVLWASPAKHEHEGEKFFVFSKSDSMLIHGHPVLLCEDVITTGGSVGLVVRALADIGVSSATTRPFVLMLVNRSGLRSVMGKKIISLIDHPMPTWTPDECPLCKLGSEALRQPKNPANWARLNRFYFKY